MLISPEGRILSSDLALPRRLGVVPADFLGADIYSFFDPESAALRRKAAAMVLCSGEPLCYCDESRPGRIYDTRIIPVYGPERRIDALTIFVRDITSEERAERERHKLAAAIEQAAEAVIIADPNFNIEYVNQAFEDMTGYSRKEVFGRDLESFYTGRLQEEQFKLCAKLLAKGEVCADRFHLVSKTGEVCVCDQSVSSVRAKYGVNLGYVFVWRDATQVSKLEEQLRRAQKMEAIGALASGIAHDFNNILGPIILHAELCLSRMHERPPLESSLPEILEAAKRAKALAGQLLHLGRDRGKDTPIPFRLSTLIKECVTLLKPGLSPDIRVKLQLDSRSDLILADPDHVHQVIMNLATNAADAMREAGGDLTFAISEETVGETNWSRHSGLPAGKYIRLTVSDTGHGMSPTCLERIFEPFFSTKARTGGVGLGLSVVQNIVARLRGALDVESEPGKGTSFHIFFPMSDVPEAVAPQPRHTMPLPRNTARILFVDDDEATAVSLTAALTGLGYAVECRVTAVEALRAFLRRPEGFDLAMLDLFMPHMNGLALAKELMYVRPDLPVVLFSAYTDRVSSEEMRQCGIKAFLSKPFDMATLDKTIRQACGQDAYEGP
ncbi:PAS domain-containing hybrid sensor histidine kinase/response regulator [Desulfolutivibrio sulfoxidireducens]|uniref:PAS domain-containing hybrid sensor histidine kinase/response regulator n=1 Tax=Desulfolutivibrio sulfoxidireducens TaxID=2773299 RepID=UPI00159DAAE1|nr:ATP-binding protein [Desulfolutivibrio sulfoxidireducens]